MQEAIGTELKISRIRNNMTMQEVADKMGFNIETLRRYENNSSGLSIEKLEKLLLFYNENIDIFFDNVCENMHKVQEIKEEKEEIMKKKEIVHLIKELVPVEKNKEETKYIEKYYDLDNNLLFIKEISMVNQPTFNYISIEKD